MPPAQKPQGNNLAPQLRSLGARSQNFGPYKQPAEVAEQLEMQPQFSGLGVNAYPSAELWAPREPTEVWNDTAIPTSYKVVNPFSSLTQGRAEVTPGATKTLIEGARRPLENGSGSALTLFERQMLEVDRFNQAVSETLRRAPKPGQFYRAGGYDIEFSPPAVPGDTPRITRIFPHGAIQDHRDDKPRLLSDEEVRALGYNRPDQSALDEKNKTGTNLQSSATGDPTTGDGEQTVFPSFNTDEADYFDIRRYMQMGSPPALALEQAKDDKRRSLALSLRDGTLQNIGQRPVDTNTALVKDLDAPQKEGVEEWKRKYRQYQLDNPGYTLPTIKVTATGYTNGGPEFSVNQQSRTEDNDPNEPTLATEHVKKYNEGKVVTSPPANSTMATAHAELVVLQRLFRKNQTKDQSLRMTVTDKAVCPYCQRDLPAAAEQAGLRDWTIFEKRTGYTLYWEKGLKTFRVFKDGEQQ